MKIKKVVNAKIYSLRLLFFFCLIFLILRFLLFNCCCRCWWQKHIQSYKGQEKENSWCNPIFTWFISSVLEIQSTNHDGWKYQTAYHSRQSRSNNNKGSSNNFYDSNLWHELFGVYIVSINLCCWMQLGIFNKFPILLRFKIMIIKNDHVEVFWQWNFILIKYKYSYISSKRYHLLAELMWLFS